MIISKSLLLSSKRYEFYTSFTLWPEQVRGDLRAGIKARNQGDLSLSERYITRYVLLNSLFLWCPNPWF
jgi:hypothetical protein